MIFAICYGIGAGTFVALIALMLLNHQPKAFGLSILLACVVTLVWAFAAALQSWWMPGVAHALGSLRSCAWLVLFAFILSSAGSRESGTAIRLWLPLAATAIGLASFGNDCRFLFSTASPLAFASSQVLARVAVSVCGILVIENLYRNTSPGRRWHVVPMCVAIGTLFAYDLFVFCEAVVLHRLDPPLLAGQGVVAALIVPLLVLTMARNPGWNIDIHVSRRVVFHGATLTASGIFLLLAAGVGGLIGRLPGEWARVSEIAFFCGSLVLLLTVLSTESLRSRLRRLIAENFFSTRYDYRMEWLRSIATLSAAGAQEPLAIRAIRAIADVVDSPGGALWLDDGAGNYRIAQLLSMTPTAGAAEPVSSEFVARFRGGEVVQDLSRDAASPDAAPRPAWSTGVWLAVPLMKVDRLLGFVVLSPPRAPSPLNWESFDLLLTIGQQVAGYLAEDHATRALLESRALIDYSRKFSFVIHDIKNVSSQLSMIIANIPRFGERAEFRADLVRGMESATRKLGDLVERLRPDAPQTTMIEFVDPAVAIGEVVREIDRNKRVLCAQIMASCTRVRIDASDLKSILTHLITNAIEASPQEEAITVRLRKEAGRVLIEIADNGCGMTAEFIRNGLFAPLRSTKPRGHGIGGYQARDLARAAGGDIEVVSAVGRGTTMRVFLPDASEDLAPLPLREATAS
jgi:putative PEP-CTERM system histidine kinase